LVPLHEKKKGRNLIPLARGKGGRGKGLRTEKEKKRNEK